MMQPWFESSSYAAVNIKEPGFISLSTLSLIPAHKEQAATRKVAVGKGHNSILVKDPPRERLPSSTLEVAGQGADSRLGPIDIDSSIEFYTALYKPHTKPTVPFHDVSRPKTFEGTMTKNRRSLQSILVPSFLQGSSSSQTLSSPTNQDMPRSRSYSTASHPLRQEGSSQSELPDSTASSILSSAITSPRDSPPLDFLLDDDPFANLSSAPYDSISRTATPVPQLPPVDATLPPIQRRSPLKPAADNVLKPSLTRALSSPPRDHLPRAFSSGRIQPRPAHQKPAFASGPSLPSLRTLAGMNVVLTKKVRKGRVGAGLPFEPWNNPSNCELPPRVLQDPSAAETQSLPLGSQPLLPSAIVALSSNAGGVVYPQAATDPVYPTIHDEPLSTSASTSNAPPSQFEESDSDPGHDLIDFYASSRTSSDDNHGAEEWAPEPSEPLVDPDTDITSCDELSPPPSSRVSSLDLSIETPISRTISSTSTGSAESVTDHKQARDTSCMTHSSEEDSDLLSSPPEPHALFSSPRYLQNTSDLVSNWRNQFRSGSFMYLEDPLLSPGFGDFYFSSDAQNATDQTSIPSASSTDTILPPTAKNRPLTYFSTESLTQVDATLVTDSPVDGNEWEGSRNTSYKHTQSYQASGSNGQSRTSNSIRHHGDGWGGGHGGDEDDDGRDGRRRINRDLFVPTSPSESTSASEDESTDECGQSPSVATTVPQKRFPVASTSSSDDDDDVPLAQRIPTALSAQQSIRKRVREERNQRKKERALREEEDVRERHTTLRPAGAGVPPAQPVAMSSSQEAAMHAFQHQPRKRTLTLPGKATHTFSPEDLAKKLESIQLVTEHQQVSSSPSSSQHPYLSRAHSIAKPRTSFESPDHNSFTTNHSRGRSVKEVSLAKYLGTTPSSPLMPALRAARSFHIADRRLVDEHEQKQLFSRTSARSRSRAREDAVPSAYSPQSRNRSLSVSNSANTPAAFEEPPVPPLPARLSVDEQHHSPRVLVKAHSARTSTEGERPSRPSLQRGSASVPLPILTNDRKTVVQQRIFIGDMQRFNMVEISSATTAGDVIEMIEAQGSLVGWAGIGKWMVWEMAQDFGMERPIRDFELLSDVQNSWNKDKMVNAFVLRMTPLAIPLSRSAIPSSSPTHAGYVQWQVKRGKWSKRWMQLKQHSIWLSKSDNGKDEVQLCALSNFDAYCTTRSHRAPKPFAFALKSTDNLAFFENTADYVHTFSCSEKDGSVWLEKILVARSYVLHQERQVLFNPKSPPGATAVSRSGTRKSASQRPSAPLVSIQPSFGVQPHVHQQVFEPGSLLHSQP